MKYLISKFGFIILCLFASYSLLAQESQQYVIDSLSARVKNEMGEVKLSTLAKLVELEFFSANVLSRLTDLETEAKKQGNDRFLLSAYNSRITYHHRHNNHDSISLYVNLSMPIGRRLDAADVIVTQNELLKTIDYTARGLFDLALVNQKRYLGRIKNAENVDPKVLLYIYIGIGNTYYYQEKFKEALKSFEQAKDLLPAIDSGTSPISLLCLLALCHVNIGDYAKAIEYYDLANKLMNDNQNVAIANNNYFLNFYAQLIAIQAYSKAKDFTKAKALIDQLPANLNDTVIQGQDDYYYSTLADYYAGIKEYDKALKYTKLGLTHLKKTNNIIVQPIFLQDEASLLYNLQHYKEAYDKLLDATQFKDSIRNSYSTLQLDELAIMYEVDLKDMEIATANSQLKFTQTMTIALTVISILLIIILLVARTNSKKQQKKNKILFKQQEELRKRVSYYRKMIVDEANNETPNAHPFFQKLERYMLEEGVHRNANISREEIAAVFNTNRQYLSATIKDQTGLTFTNYINKYRLEDARKQLLENDEVVIDDIIIASGFSSRSTFHRLFKEQYGMAPHELKRASIALQNKIMKTDKEDL